jgi:FKBP-type peptidyl-prolyl cis-trans isomerase
MLSGLRILDVTIGDGPSAEPGSRVTVRYTGYLNRGEVFERDVVVTFTVGSPDVAAGLAHGVEGMRVGGRRRLRAPAAVPPDGKLTFDVELIAVE